MKTLLAAILAGAVAAAPAAPAPPTLKVPGSPDRAVTPESLLGAGQSDVRLESTDGDVVVYHGRTLLEVLEKGGLDTKTMPSQRQLAPAVVIVTARDGYAVVFSAGELLANRADPKVFLVSETAAGALPADQGPVRLIVYGDRARSSYALARIELKYLAENTRERKP